MIAYTITTIATMSAQSGSALFFGTVGGTAAYGVGSGVTGVVISDMCALSGALQSRQPELNTGYRVIAGTRR